MKDETTLYTERRKKLNGNVFAMEGGWGGIGRKIQTNGIASLQHNKKMYQEFS